MNHYIQALKEYASAQPYKYGEPDIHSFIEMLYRLYSEYNPIDNSAVQHDFQRLEKYLSSFSLQEIDQIFDLLCSIYAKCEQAAFLDGVCVGAKIITELFTNDNL